jgi:formate dehydrogenase major subunit
VQRLYKAFEPLGDSKPDWQVITDIANRLGADWRYEHPADIMEEAAMLSPLYAGVTYERLEGYNSLQWPVAADGTDSPLLFTDKFPFSDGKAVLYPVQWTEPKEFDEDMIFM